MTRTRAVGFLKSPEIPLEGNFFRFPREEEKSRTRAVGFLKTPEIPLEGNFSDSLGRKKKLGPELWDF